MCGHFMCAFQHGNLRTVRLYMATDFSTLSILKDLAEAARLLMTALEILEHHFLCMLFVD